MRITIVAVGSTGDVGPYLGVGRHLATAGHEVRVATHEIFRSWVEHVGLGYGPLPMNPRAQLDDDLAARIRKGGVRGAKAVAGAFEPWVGPLTTAIDMMADGSDLLVLSALGCTGLYSAELRGIPALRLHLQPMEPTKEFPPPAFGASSRGSTVNLVLGRAAKRAMIRPYLPLVDELRRRHGQRAWSPGEHHEFIDNASPVLHGYSPLLSPRPVDWPDGHEVVGYWPVPPAPEWHTPPGLAAFIADGPPPIYVGFGSTKPATQRRLEEMVLSTLRRSDVRVVVDAGWGSWSVSHDRVFNVDGIHHRWLFPQMSAVVHHAGSGTTGAAVLSGVPSVTVPVSLDQPFWAQRLAEAGVATKPIPAQRLTDARMAEALSRAQHPDMRMAAAALADQVRQEDGLAAVLRHVERARGNLRHR